MKALRGLIRKEALHILRDRRTLIVLLLMPLTQVILFGFALRTDVDDVRLAIVDPQPDVATLRIRDRLTATDSFRVVTTLRSTSGLEELFQRSDIQQAIVFPPRFSSEIAHDGRSSILIINDASDPNTAAAIDSYARAVILGAIRTEGRAPASPSGIQVETRMRFNPTLESENLFVPGLLAFVLMLVAALMTSISIAREKETGTMEILLVSPLRPWQVIIGKVLPYLILGFCTALLAIGAAVAIFRVPLRGSVALLLAESLLFILLALALGVLISAKAETQLAAMMASLIGLLLPTAMLSGMIFPIESMPGWLQVVTNIIPARWFILIARGIMLKGVGLEYLWQETLILTGMLTLFLVLGAVNFRQRLE